jgi:hypothetical protein
MVKTAIKTAFIQYVVMDARLRRIWASMAASMIAFARAKGGRSAAGIVPRAHPNFGLGALESQVC